MKNRFLLACIFTSIFSSINANTQLLLSRLTLVNSEWSKQPEKEIIAASFTGNLPNQYNDWIALHLKLVEATLRARPTHHLSAEQKYNRIKALNHLNSYWKAGVFPINDYVNYTTPVFIDRKGTHCAVGYLMQQSGAEALAQSIDQNEKFAYVHQIKTKGVAEWAKINGFSIEELAWIQPAYQVNQPTFEMEGGFDSTVNCIVKGSNNNLLFAGGAFTKTGKGVSCNNVAAWISGFAGYDWISLGSGLNGEVHTLVYDNGKLYAGGKFTKAGNITANHVAMYDENAGTWQSMGSLDSTVLTLCFYKGELYAGGSFSGMLAKWDGTNWQNVSQGMLYGEAVRILKVIDTMLYIGGNFELTTGALRKNVALYDGKNILISGFGTTNPVNDFEFHNGKIYAACDVISGNDTSALAIFENGEWKTVLKPLYGMLDLFNGNTIKKIKSVGSKLLACGDFESASGMIYGKNLMAYYEQKNVGDTSTYTICEPIISTDKSINTFLLDGQIVYFGGEFLTSGYNDTLNHVGYTEFITSSINHFHSSETPIRIVPNPASRYITVSTWQAEALKTVEITDIAGNVLLAKSVENEKTVINIENLPSGVYLLKANSNQKWGIARFVKM